MRNIIIDSTSKHIRKHRNMVVIGLPKKLISQKFVPILDYYIGELFCKFGFMRGGKTNRQTMFDSKPVRTIRQYVTADEKVEVFRER